MSRSCAGYQSDTASSNISGGGQAPPKKGSLKDYVDKFSPETVQEMARIVSQEAAQLIDMQASALFGDYRQLQEQMQVKSCVLLFYLSHELFESSFLLRNSILFRDPHIHIHHSHIFWEPNLSAECK